MPDRDPECLELRRDLKSTMGKLNRTEEQRDSAERALTRAEAMLDDAKREMAELRHKLIRTQENAERDTAELNHKLRDAWDDLAIMHRKREAAEEECGSKKRKIDQLHKNQEHASAKIERDGAAIHKLRNVCLEKDKELDHKDHEIDQRNREINRLRQELLSVEVNAKLSVVKREVELEQASDPLSDTELARLSAWLDLEVY